jgi:HEPN domain-containing protein
MSPHDVALQSAKINDFALRAFRDVADGDYISARMAYRAELFTQAYWASQQALEKYIKAILLLRRIPQPKTNGRIKPSHHLHALLKELEVTFPLKLYQSTRGFIEYIDAWNEDRYFIYPYGSAGIELMELDRAVWDLRRYSIPRHQGLSPKGTPLEVLDLKRIEDAVNHPPQRYRSLSTGLLEKVLRDQRNAARSALVWKNLYFGTGKRDQVTLKQTFTSHNSPLALHPEIFDELKEFVFLPREAAALNRPPQKGQP